MFFRIFQHLLPNARAWRITVDKQLRQYFEGLSGIGTDISAFYDGVWLDIFPNTTRDISAWEIQWGLPNTVTDEQARRDRLDATWKALGGQSPGYIQDTLRGVGFDVYVHEWWVPGSEPAIGVQAAATARNPFTYLNDGTGAIKYASTDGALDMQDGDTVAQDGGTLTLAGYALVNKLFESATAFVGDGSSQMLDGGAIAQDGAIVASISEKKYPIPADSTKYPYFLYIGGQTFPSHATVSSARRNEFETLCLKICPAQQWLGILVDYA